VGILVLGGALRLWGVRFGLPSALLHLDEPPVVFRAREILQSGDGNPHWFHYPSFYLYLQVFLQAVGRVGGRTDPFLLARLSSVAAGVLTLWVTYALGRESLGRAVGLLGALFLATSFLHSRESHFATVDAAATLFVTASVYLSVVALKRSQTARTALVGAAALAGLAAGTKYNAGLVGVAPAVAALAGGRGGRSWPWVGGVVAAAGLVFLLTTPYAILDWDAFVEDIRFESRHYREGHFGFEGGFNAAYFARYLFSPGLGEGIVLFLVVGLVASIARRDRALAPILGFLAVYYVSISAVRVNFVRNLMPILPVLCVLAGWGVWVVVERLPAQRVTRMLTTGALLAGLVVLPIWRTATYSRAISHSTRVDAARWIAEHVPRGSTLAFELYGPENLPGGYRVLMVLHLSDRPLQWYEAQGVDYLVASSGAYEMAYSNSDRYPEVVARYDEIFRRFPVVHQIPGETIDPLYSSISPTIRILRGPDARSPTTTARDR